MKDSEGNTAAARLATNRQTKRRGNEIPTLAKAMRVVAVLQESFHGDIKIDSSRKYNTLMAAQCNEKGLLVLLANPDRQYKASGWQGWDKFLGKM